MKRLISVIVVIAMMLGSMASAYANESKSSEYYLVDGSNSIKIQKTNSAVKITENKIKSIEFDAEGRKTEEHFSTSTLLIPIESSVDELYQMVLNNQTLTHTNTEADKNACARFTLSVTYNKTTVDGFDYYKITNVSGGFSDNGTSGSYVGENVYVTSQNITVHQKGYTQAGPFISQIDSASFSPSNRSWTYTPPSTWVPIKDLAIYEIVGVQYFFTLSRGSSSWTSVLDDSILFSDLSF